MRFGFGMAGFAAAGRKLLPAPRTRLPLAEAIANLQDGAVLVDAQHCIVTVNPRMAAIVPGFVAGAMLPEEFETVRPNGELPLPDGRWLRLTRGDTPDGGFLLIVTDITLARRRDLRLRASKDQAESADRAKSSFLANMSHELRTPLNAVIGLAEIIATESLGPNGQPRYRDFAADIVHSGRHLLEVVNDILDIAKLHSGTTALRLQPVCARSLANEAVRIVRRQAEEAGVKLTLTIVSEPPRIPADGVRLRQALLNLLSNAIKFTPAGGTVGVTVESSAHDLSIIVHDTGIGMTREEIPLALQPFVQLDSGLSRRRGGTGLGLPLAKSFVELHGGRFTLHSEPGKGTTVTAVLPAAMPARRLAAA